MPPSLRTPKSAMPAAWGKGDIMGTERTFEALTVLLPWWLGHGSTTFPQLMQDWFPSKSAMVEWLAMCLWLCKASPDPCAAGDNRLWISAQVCSQLVYPPCLCTPCFPNHPRAFLALPHHRVGVSPSPAPLSKGLQTAKECDAAG